MKTTTTLLAVGALTTSLLSAGSAAQAEQSRDASPVTRVQRSAQVEQSAQTEELRRHCGYRRRVCRTLHHAVWISREARRRAVESSGKMATSAMPVRDADLSYTSPQRRRVHRHRFQLMNPYYLRRANAHVGWHFHAGRIRYVRTKNSLLTCRSYRSWAVAYSLIFGETLYKIVHKLRLCSNGHRVVRMPHRVTLFRNVSSAISVEPPIVNRHSRLPTRIFHDHYEGKMSNCIVSWGCFLSSYPEMDLTVGPRLGVIGFTNWWDGHLVKSGDQS